MNKRKKNQSKDSENLEKTLCTKGYELHIQHQMPVIFRPLGGTALETWKSLPEITVFCATQKCKLKFYHAKKKPQKLHLRWKNKPVHLKATVNPEL